MHTIRSAEAIPQAREILEPLLSVAIKVRLGLTTAPVPIEESSGVASCHQGAVCLVQYLRRSLGVQWRPGARLCTLGFVCLRKVSHRKSLTANARALGFNRPLQPLIDICHRKIDCLSCHHKRLFPYLNRPIQPAKAERIVSIKHK